MSPISSGGKSFSYSPPTPQSEEIKNALKVLIEACAEASMTGGKISTKLFEKCKEALGAIANDPKMPQKIHDDAKTALEELEHIHGQPNAGKILDSIVHTVQQMKTESSHLWK